MKRLVAAFLCMTMVGTMTACGSSEKENNKATGKY